MVCGAFVSPGPESVKIPVEFRQLGERGFRHSLRTGIFSARHCLLPQHELAGLQRHSRCQFEFAHEDFSLGGNFLVTPGFFQNGKLLFQLASGGLDMRGLNAGKILQSISAE